MKMLISLIVFLYEQFDEVREHFWSCYDSTVWLVLDELELWGIIRSKNYSTS